ncbi:hypothetical protein VPIG_00024 [Vibrio phage PWH3a-P1]|uniref:hypothetical protein n=1 Tax=Vibrio phage PWH3a-P1 TaxID=754058 RepID=UPI0002C0A7A6|nr:hypothetical protein VPIG_00024 [Vibrio phage PWH3a-P1]AGH31882.1 hypothetical protein VPIG_00024 [Vibrio phage PWH3a-P1]
MKKVIFTTNMIRSGTGMFVSVDENNNFHDHIFVAVNNDGASSNFAYYVGSEAVSNGRSFTSSHDAWCELCQYMGADEIYPVPQKWLKSEFKDEYKLKLAEFKDNLSETKMKEREAKKLKSKKQSGGLWLKSHGGKGYWN